MSESTEPEGAELSTSEKKEEEKEEKAVKNDEDSKMTDDNPKLDKDDDDVSDNDDSKMEDDDSNDKKIKREELLASAAASTSGEKLPPVIPPQDDGDTSVDEDVQDDNSSSSFVNTTANANKDSSSLARSSSSTAAGAGGANEERQATSSNNGSQTGIIASSAKKRRGRKKKVVPLSFNVCPPLPVSLQEGGDDKVEVKCPCVFSCLSKPHEAETSLRYVDPFGVYACKQHAAFVDKLIVENVSSGKILFHREEKKDACCSLCGSVRNQNLIVSCSNAGCCYSFCTSCIIALQDSHTHDSTPVQSFEEIKSNPNWSCFVCEAMKLTGKPCKRDENLRTIVATTTSQDKKDKQLLAQIQSQYIQQTAGAGFAAGSRAESELTQLMQKAVLERLDVCAMESFSTDPRVKATMDSIRESVNLFARLNSFGTQDPRITRCINDQLLLHVRESTWLFENLSLHGTNPQELAKITTIEQLEARKNAIDQLRIKTETLFGQFSQLLPILKQQISDKEAIAAQLSFALNQSSPLPLQQNSDFMMWNEMEFMKEEERLRQKENELTQQLKDVQRELNHARRSDMRSRDEILQRIERERLGLTVHQAKERGQRNAMKKYRDNESFFRTLKGALTQFDELHRSAAEDLIHRRHDHADFTCPDGVVGDFKPPTTAIRQVPPVMQTAAYYDPDTLKHAVPDFHCESTARIIQLIEVIEELALHPSKSLRVQREVPLVDERFIRAVHDQEYIDYLNEILPLEISDPPTVVCAGVSEDTEHAEDLDPESFDTFVTWGSWAAAKRAAGAVICAIDAVSNQECRNAFCAVRPPGHHAGKHGQTDNTSSQGFCLINNVAIGAKYAVSTMNYERVAVVDFDAHHGNGTQDILGSDDPAEQKRFLFISIHVYDEHKYFFPGTGNAGDGPANVLNVPLRRNSASAAFISAFETQIIPRLDQFKPQLLLLSAGFDGHMDDPTRGLRLEEHDYYKITQMLLGVAQRHCSGRVVSVLEGGYDTNPRTTALARCVRYHLMALMNQDAPDGSGSPMPIPPSPTLCAQLDSPVAVSEDETMNDDKEKEKDESAKMEP